MQYLNAKFPLEYVYSGAHGVIPNPGNPGNPGNPDNPGNPGIPAEDKDRAPKNQGRQRTDVLVLFCFVLFCFVCFFVLFFFVS